MGTTTQRTTHSVSASYTDVVTSIPGAANASGLLKNLSGYTIDVVKGGASAPGANVQGVKLLPFGEEYCEAANIWVRCDPGALVAFDVLG